ncbi:PREDICTED: pachytene checkpoint protein 2 homolog [Dufourea novaeangliae]|uniref:Pachytene checkpoint protein 2 like protein n=1 Tax=Dufourea novaeangliae TaxID=178035 RepID=A0A154NWR4_DUFNO|nr:PREDICTED: pachytene checkpoint protein 2 homolog [Dufourea novaeangliae]KZC04109.1 Pachytene checkpoint protein 2 like protein [Dufourea novaeangliae]
MEGPDVIHVEICQKSNSLLSKKEIQKLVYAETGEWKDITLETPIYGDNLLNPTLRLHVDSIICSISHGERSHVKVQGSTLLYHVYRLTEEDAATETIQNNSEDLPASSHWILPSKEFHSLWENLYFDSNIKEDLLHFVETTMIFSDHSVNSNIINWNKVVLLHGPPGTGKTSLCKALAQKVAIRLADRFTHSEFVEINSHSLFSKWFSESGKLVMKLFNEIRSLLESSQALVCILIDEIESLAHARKSCSNGVEPTDSIRVVNALLTQLDQIKKYPNVLILTTSNLSEAIDLAFIDRADIKQYIGEPTIQAIYKIYASCLKELIRAGLMEPEEICDLPYLKNLGYEENTNTKNSLKLLDLSQESHGLSGRVLRKIPFLAHAFYLRTKRCTLTRFLRAMHLAVKRQKEEETEDVLQVSRNLEYKLELETE